MAERGDIVLTDREDCKESSSNTGSGIESVQTSVSPQPYALPPWFERFECMGTDPTGLVWCTCDLTVEECCADICDLLMEKAKQEQVHDTVVILTPEFLRWSCYPLGYLPSLHIGIWDSSLGKLVAFLAAVPIRLRVMENNKRTAWTRLFAERNEFRDRITWKIIHNELDRRILHENMRWIVRKPDVPAPVQSGFLRFERPLNLRTLFDRGYFKSSDLTLGNLVEIFKLPPPPPPDVQGLKVMNASHVESLTSLLNTYLREFKVAREYEEEEVKHYFLPSPTANFVHSYVYVGPDENITGFCSFVILREITDDVEFTSAFSFYTFTVGMPLQQLLTDAMVIALENHCDLFVAYDMMSIKDFLNQLRFHGLEVSFKYVFHLDDSLDLKKADIGLVLL